jgi:protein-arginine kinase activator protein McsA
VFVLDAECWRDWVINSNLCNTCKIPLATQYYVEQEMKTLPITVLINRDFSRSQNEQEEKWYDDRKYYYCHHCGRLRLMKLKLAGTKVSVDNG